MSVFMEEFHQRAVERGVYADETRRRGATVYAHLYSDALDWALRAIDAARNDNERPEPLYSQVHRDAAGFALNCDKPVLARSLATRALNDNPHPSVETALKEALDEANARIDMSAVYIGFLDWNNGGIIENEFHKVSVPNHSRETIADAARDLVEEGAGYFEDADYVRDDQDEDADDSIPPTPERYYVHSAVCLAGVDYRAWRIECDCDYIRLYSGELTH